MTGLTCHLTEVLFQRRERTDPSLEFNQRSPYYGRKVQKNDPAPTKHKQPAEDNKADEH
jgi:hypothetical protein|tara:strand:+ start:5195 stop:5371 length:177 start_codon:yes stop_codon:yes gene_type:complete